MSGDSIVIINSIMLSFLCAAEAPSKQFAAAVNAAVFIWLCLGFVGRDRLDLSAPPKVMSSGVGSTVEDLKEDGAAGILNGDLVLAGFKLKIDL